jgi:acyl dehydratase
MGARAFADVEEGAVLPELRRIVTREDVKAYAEVGGDQNPLHQDDEVARAAGFDGIIAHGMFTMGVMAACLTSWLGDPAAVRRLQAQFRSPVFMGEELVAGGRVRSVDAQERTATLELWVTVEREGDREWPIKRGEALVQLG